MFSLIKELFGIGTTILKGKQLKAAAKAELEAKLIGDQASWEMYQAKASADSWKDEYWTVILSMPVLMAFIGVPFCAFFMPDKLDILRTALAGQFELLDAVPEWYVWAMGASIAASFGFKTAGKLGVAKALGKK